MMTQKGVPHIKMHFILPIHRSYKL